MRSSALSIAAACAFLAVVARADPAAPAAVAEDLSKRDYTTSSYSYGIADWQTCHPGKDSCSNSGSKCCIAKADKHSGKYTCRPAGKDCDDDYGHGSTYYGDDSSSGDYYGDDSPAGGYYGDDSYSGDYSDYSSGDYYDDSSSSGYNGARARLHRGASGPRHAKAGHSRSRGLMHSKAYDDSYSYGVADWKTCHPSSDSCSNPSAKCCIAKSDKGSGKYTCRPAGKDCDDHSYDSYGGSNGDSSYGGSYDDSSYGGSYDDSSYSGSYDDSSYGGSYDDSSYSGSYGDSSYGGDSSYSPYSGARARQSRPGHQGARARPQGNNHVDVCKVTYETYVGNCDAAYAQTHKKEEHEKCLGGAEAWVKICKAQT
ncbi:hypothetical protein BJ742DRAFT_811474 [Cladochytrium replicatum]|nr:hypothetical protein BJ742DRAFT_811474 [Cladochytrium replicatum]